MTDASSGAAPSPGTSTLEGQVALVTGATRGLARAIAARLTTEGASVAILGRVIRESCAAATELSDLGAPCYAVAGDVTDHASVERAVGKAQNVLGPID